MEILGIEVTGDAISIVILHGNKDEFTLEENGKFLKLPPKSKEISDILEFQTNLEMFLQNRSFEKLVLCEGGNDSSKKRIRMEYAILSECVKQNIPYETYPTGSSTKIINSGYEKATGRTFQDDFQKLEIPLYFRKVLAATWRFL